MKAAKLVDYGRIEIHEVPTPDVVNETDVQVQVKAVGICGTDIHMFKEPRADVALPRIMGHELTGIVTKVGNGVTLVKEGDRVALDPVYACGTCPICKKGHPNVCPGVKCYGVQMDGGFCEYIVTGEEHLYPFSSKISFEDAALVEPFSIANNILDRAALTSGENLLIIGAGTIGLAILQVAKMKGARVMITDVIPEKLGIAKDMGADVIVNSKEESLKDKAAAFADIGFDIVIDAVGITPLFQSALEYAAPCARIICIGFDGRAAQISPVTITKKELSIIGSRMNNYKFPEVIEWLEEGNIQADKMITMKYSLDCIQTAFEETIANSSGNVKTIIVFN